MSMTKQNLGFPLDVQNRTEVCKITNLNRINTKIIKTRVAINMPFWFLFLILKLCKITKFAFVFLWKNFRFQIFMKSPLKINITKQSFSFFVLKRNGNLVKFWSSKTHNFGPQKLKNWSKVRSVYFCLLSNNSLPENGNSICN